MHSFSDSINNNNEKKKVDLEIKFATKHFFFLNETIKILPTPKSS